MTYLATIRDEKIDTEVILITAANELENVKRSLHLGVLDYLVKPFSFERFQQSIENYQKKAAQFTLETKELSQTKSGPIVSFFTDKRT